MGTLGILHLATALFGFIIAAKLIFSFVKNQAINRFLGIAFFAMAYRSLSIFALEENLVKNTFLMGSVSYIYYIIPPAFYLYFRHAIDDQQSLQRKDIKHLIIPFLALLLLTYYVLFTRLTTGRWSLPEQMKGAIVPDAFFFIKTKFHVVLICSLATFYWAVSWRLLFTKLGLKRGQDEHPQVGKIRRWILTLLLTSTLLLTVLLLSGILNWMFGLQFGNLSITKLNIIRSIVLFLIFSRVLFNSDLLFGIPMISTALPVVDIYATQQDFPQQMMDNPIYPSPLNTESIPEKTSDTQEQALVNSEVHFDENGWIHLQSEKWPQPKPTMQDDKVKQYISDINFYINEKQPFKNPEFDMKTISRHLDIPYYYLEYIFRYYNKYSFIEFRNQLRVRYVMDAFEKGKLLSYTTEAIGQEAGFSSRSTFFRIFKSVTGRTPKQFG